jgi:hypothetical protein
MPSVTKTPPSSSVRPIGVWVVSLFFFCSAAVNGVVPLLAWGLAQYYAPDASGALDFNLNFIVLPPLMASGLACLAALALLQLKRAAFALFGCLFVVLALTMVWELAVIGTFELLGGAALLVRVPEIALALAAWLYVARLRRKAVLT